MAGSTADKVMQDGWFERWARFAVRRRALVLIVWLIGLVIFGGVSTRYRGSFGGGFDLPGTESQKALNVLKDRFPAQAGDTAQLVFEAPGGVSQPGAQAHIAKVIEEAKALPHVVNVGSPFQPGAGGVSPDGTIAFTTVNFDKLGNQIPRSDLKQVLDLVNRSSTDQVRVEAGGNVIAQSEQEPPGKSEGIGFIAAIFILLVAFGSVVAMGLPLIAAVLGLMASFFFMFLAANVLNLPIFAPQFASMIGLGVGIDYSLFIVTRYREARAHGMNQEDATVLALGTAGRAVLFAGLVVVVSMFGMLAMGIPFVGALGIAGAIVVGFAVLVALTLLPALLGGWFGRNIDKWSIPLFHANETGDKDSVWYRFAATIQRRPWPWAIGSLAVTLLLAAPVLKMNLGFSDAGNSGEQLHSRRAYDLLKKGFGPGFNAPILLVFDAQGNSGDRLAPLTTIREKVVAWPGVAFVSPPQPNPQGDAAVMTVVTLYAPQDKQVETMVHELREKAIPQATAGTGVRGYVAGATPAFIDIGDRIRERMPVFFGAVIGLSFILLMVVFRSVMVPLKAAIMNLLSIGASFGVVVAIFQFGWGADLFGIKPGPIEVFLPMMLFSILFGLSMDYEVFLISRIREEYLNHGRNSDAVAHGLSTTARVITAAAAIMISVFVSFVLGPNRTIKEFGVGLATAIFVDATIVRLILVPSTMELLGNANWWLPRWLDKLLPNLDVEGAGRYQDVEPSGMAAD